MYCSYYLIFSLYAAWDFTTDDAYISWFYARQLVNGNGLYWHQLMSPVEGYSNFLWVLVASLVIKMHWPLVLTMKWISVSSLGVGLIFLYRLARLFLSPLLAILPVFLFSHYIGIAWWTVSGLESAFFCALSIGLMWQCIRAWGYKPYQNSVSLPISKSTYSWINTNIILLLLALTRFEGVVWVVPIGCFILCQLKKDKPSYLLNDYKVIWSLITFCCFLLPYTIYFIWRINYFGHWIPNSYSCKALIPGQIGIVDLDYLRVIIFLIVAALPYFLSVKDCRSLLLWLPSILYGLMLWKADPILAHRLRLFLGPFALFSLLPVLGIQQFVEYFQLSDDRIKLITCLSIILLTVLLIPGNNLSDLQVMAANYQDRNQNRIHIATLLNAQAKHGATVLLGDCGIIPFNTRTDIRFIDSQCLNNPELTQPYFHNNPARYVKYLQQTIKPDWIIVSTSLYEERKDSIIEWVKKENFVAYYQLVETLQSGTAIPKSPNSQKSIDYIYWIYKRIS